MEIDYNKNLDSEEESGSEMEFDGEENQEKENETKSRRVYSAELKKMVMSYFIRYNFSMTILKYSIPRGTLKCWITSYKKEGDDFFLDKRAHNGTKSIDEADTLLCNYINNFRKLYLPVPPKMVKDQALKLMES